MSKAVPQLLCLCGLAATGYGLWSLHPSAAAIVLGGVAIAVGISEHRRQNKELKR